MENKVTCVGCYKTIPERIALIQNKPDATEWVRSGYCSLKCFKENPNKTSFVDTVESTLKTDIIKEQPPIDNIKESDRNNIKAPSRELENILILAKKLSHPSVNKSEIVDQFLFKGISEEELEKIKETFIDEFLNPYMNLMKVDKDFYKLSGSEMEREIEELKSKFLSNLIIDGWNKKLANQLIDYCNKLSTGICPKCWRSNVRHAYFRLDYWIYIGVGLPAGLIGGATGSFIVGFISFIVFCGIAGALLHHFDKNIIVFNTLVCENCGNEWQ